LDEVTTARQEYYSAENDLLSAEKNLSLTLGETEGDIALADMSQADIDGLIESRAASLAEKGEGTVQSLDLDNLLTDLEQLRAELEAAHVYDPDFDISASLSFPDPSFTGTVSFSFSPDDIQNDDVDTLKENILSKEEQIAQELFSLDLQRQMLSSQVAMNLEMTDLSRSALEDAELALAEVEFLAQEGERTSLERASAKLDVRNAELSLYKSACAVATAQGDLLMLYN